MSTEGAAGRYRLTGQHWQGVHGRIVAAHDRHLGREVALKVARARDGAESDYAGRRSTLVHEAKCLATLSHPGIVPIYDFFEVSDGVSFVMPFLPRTLADPGLDIATLLGALEDVARALDHCAASGIAHRDVKPQNILLGGAGSGCLCDFGLAAPFDAAANWQGILGTDPYIPPEAFLAEAVPMEARPAYDQFSLGVTAYQAITGRLPFGQDAPPQDRAARATGRHLLKHRPYPPCHQLRPDAPRGAQAVIARMLSVDPAERFPTCLEAAQALRQAFLGAPAGPCRIFISYAREQADLAAQLAAGLTEAGLSAWFDQGLVAGLDWSEQIEAAMEESDAMLVLLSGAAAASEEVRLEWSYWLDQLRRPLLSAVVEPCRIPYRLYARQQVIATAEERAQPARLAARIAAALPALFVRDADQRQRREALRLAFRAPAEAPLASSVTMFGQGPHLSRSGEDPFAPDEGVEVTVIRARPLASFATALPHRPTPMDEFRTSIGPR